MAFKDVLIRHIPGAVEFGQNRRGSRALGFAEEAIWDEVAKQGYGGRIAEEAAPRVRRETAAEAWDTRRNLDAGVLGLMNQLGEPTSEPFISGNQFILPGGIRPKIRLPMKDQTRDRDGVFTNPIYPHQQDYTVEFNLREGIRNGRGLFINRVGLVLPPLHGSPEQYEGGNILLIGDLDTYRGVLDAKNLNETLIIARREYISPVALEKTALRIYDFVNVMLEGPEPKRNPAERILTVR